MRTRNRPRGQTVAMQVATAMAALLLAGGLVIRMSAPLSSSSPSARHSITNNGMLDMSLDRSTPLFGQVVLTPGVAQHACAVARVSSPDDLADSSLLFNGFSGSASLAAVTWVRIETAAAPSGPAPCEDFQPETVVVDGLLADVGFGGSGIAPPSTNAPVEPRDVWFRVSLLLPETAPTEVQGQAVSSMEVEWTVSVLTTSERRWSEQVLLLLGGLAEHSVLPLLTMLIAALLFLGIQDRIDRRDPKLAVAPVLHGFVPFERLREPSAEVAARDVSPSPDTVSAVRLSPM